MRFSSITFGESIQQNAFYSFHENYLSNMQFILQKIPLAHIQFALKKKIIRISILSRVETILIREITRNLFH